MAIDTTKLPLYVQNLLHGVDKSMTGTNLGLREVGTKLANALGVDTGSARQEISDAEKENATKQAHGAYGLAGEVLGNPVTYLGGMGAGSDVLAGKLAENLGPKAVKLAQSILSGGASGTVNGAIQPTFDPNNTLAANAKNAGIQGAAGITLGTVLPAAGAIVNAGADKLGGAYYRALSAFGDDSAKTMVASDILAKPFVSDKYTPGQIGSLINQAQNSPVKPTFGEITQNPNVLSREKTLLKGIDDPATTMQEAMKDRANKVIPQAMLNSAAPLAQTGSEASGLYLRAATEANNPSVSAQENQFNTMQSLDQQVKDRLSQIGGVKNNPETDALNNIQNRLDVSKERGNSFDSLLDAKHQIDEMYSPNATDAVSSKANSYVARYGKDINGVLTGMAPNNYPAANDAHIQGLAAQQLQDAALGTQGLRQKYNSVFGTPEKQQDFFSKVPDDQKANLETLVDHLDKVTKGHADSGTAYNVGAINDLNHELTGINTDVLNPAKTTQNIFEKLANTYTPGIKQKVADLALNPDQSITDSLMRLKDRASQSALNTPYLNNASSLGTLGLSAMSQPTLLQDHEDLPPGFQIQHESLPDGFVIQGAK